VTGEGRGHEASGPSRDTEFCALPMLSTFWRAQWSRAGGVSLIEVDGGVRPVGVLRPGAGVMGGQLVELAAPLGPHAVLLDEG